MTQSPVSRAGSLQQGLPKQWYSMQPDCRNLTKELLLW